MKTFFTLAIIASIVLAQAVVVDKSKACKESLTNGVTLFDADLKFLMESFEKRDAPATFGEVMQRVDISFSKAEGEMFKAFGDCKTACKDVELKERLLFGIGGGISIAVPTVSVDVPSVSVNGSLGGLGGLGGGIAVTVPSVSVNGSVDVPTVSVPGFGFDLSGSGVSIGVSTPGVKVGTNGSVSLDLNGILNGSLSGLTSGDDQADLRSRCLGYAKGVCNYAEKMEKSLQTASSARVLQAVEANATVKVDASINVTVDPQWLKDYRAHRVNFQADLLKIDAECQSLKVYKKGAAGRRRLSLSPLMKRILQKVEPKPEPVVVVVKPNFQYNKDELVAEMEKMRVYWLGQKGKDVCGKTFKEEFELKSMTLMCRGFANRMVALPDFCKELVSPYRETKENQASTDTKKTSVRDQCTKPLLALNAYCDDHKDFFPGQDFDMEIVATLKYDAQAEFVSTCWAAKLAAGVVASLLALFW